MCKELIINALRYRECALFKSVNDSQIFAIRLPDGGIGYCCPMGNAGEHYSLGFYRGESGFTTYLNSISKEVADALDMFEKMCSFHAINCDFENANQCETPKAERDLIRKMADEEGIKICRPKGWPDLVVLDGPVQYTGVPNEDDRRAMALALQAGCEVARKIKGLDSRQLTELGFADFYAPPVGGKMIPLLTLAADGKWSWGKTVTPPKRIREFINADFNEPAVASRIKMMPHDGTLQCRLTYSPMPIGDRKSRYFPIGILSVLLPEGVPAFMPHFEKEEEGWLSKTLSEFGKSIIESGICPAIMEVDDKRTYSLLHDFCKKTGIALRRIDYAAEVRELWLFMSSLMR